MITPPPTPNRPLNAPAAVAMAASRARRDDIDGILRPVPAPPADALSETLRPLVDDPARAAVLLDVDGTLAPIVRRAEEAHVPSATSRLLSLLARRYACVACVSGRSAAEARRLVGVGGVSYAGAHGAELLEAGASVARVSPAFKEWRGRIQAFAADHDVPEMRTLRIRAEDKGAIVAYHWRGVPDEDAAYARLRRLAFEAQGAGLGVHWGRKVLEVRPPVSFDKGQAVRELVLASRARSALYAGDDRTDLDAFDALDALVAEGELGHAVRVGVRSDEGPSAIVRRADITVAGAPELAEVLAVLAGSA